MLKRAFYFVLASAGISLAANQGRITSLTFAGGYDQNHPDVVQLTLEGGYAATGCDGSLAAIRKVDTHLISAALTAYSIGATVSVSLDAGHTYFPGRCTISSLSIVQE
jgi:hypothetical protein